MKARQSLKNDERPRPVLVCFFARFAAYGVKGRQVATGNEPVARDNNTILTLKPGEQN